MSEVAALLISEDGSRWAFDTLEGLCWSIFDWLTPRLGRGAWLSFAPVNEAARAATTANMWKSKRPRDTHEILRLCEAIATQLILLAPHYSIETWLFANLRRLRELGVAAPILDDWERDLSILDRTAKPKHALPLSTRDYPQLAQLLDSDALYRLGTSFTAAHGLGG